MRWLIDRVRWLAVPLAAYIAITLGLPLANGAAQHAEFVHHAGWVVGGCALVVAIAVAGAVLVELARWLLRVTNQRGGRA